MSEQLPGGNTLTPEQIRHIRGRLEGHLSEHQKITLADVSRQSGVSYSALYNWRAGKVERDAIAEAMRLWLDREDLREKSDRGKDYVRTEIAEQIRAVVHLADRRGMIAAIVAPSGAGKTHVARATCKETSGVFITAMSGLTERQLVTNIADAIGRHPTFRSRMEAHRWIVRMLKGTHRPVFVDEAHLLGAKIAALRSIFDEAGVAIILLGTMEILSLCDDRSGGAGQLASRTIRFNAIDLAAGEGDPGGGRFAGRHLFSIEEIEEFFASRKIRATPDALRLAWQLANLPGFGALRLIEHAAGVALDITPGLELLSGQHLVAALKLLHGADYPRMQRMAEQSEEQSASYRVA